MPDNQLVIDLQNANDAILAADVRVRIFDSGATLFATLATTKDTITPGRFFATVSGAEGVYFGHVEVRSDSVWYQTGQQIDPFLWSGTAFLYPATLAQVNAAGFTTDRNNAVIAMAKQLGLITGVTATHDPDGITVSDGDGSTVITDNLDGSYTVSKAP